MIAIPYWLLCLLVGFSVPSALIMLFALVYFITGIHDLHFVKYEKVDNKCPYEIEVDHKWNTLEQKTIYLQLTDKLVM